MRLRCGRCGTVTDEEMLFCTGCRRSLTPPSRYDLRIEDHAYPPDQSNLELLGTMGVLPYLVKKFLMKGLEKSVAQSSVDVVVEPPHPLDAVVRECAGALCLRHLPKVIVIKSDRLNAFTFGTDECATIVLTSRILSALTEEEVRAVVSHELSHVKSRHMLYHTLAEYLATGATLSASLLGLNMISMPLRLALLSWHRESEVTADRAGLLVVGDLKVIRSLMAKLMISSDRGHLKSIPDLDREAGLIESASELLQTHPLYSERMKLAAEFFRSPEFHRARRKMEERRWVLKALLPVCRFCGARKPVHNLFCPSCGKCQI